MDREELESILHYPLRRWLRKQRTPDDAKRGVKVLVDYLLLCRVGFIKGKGQKPPTTPEC